MYRIYLRIIMTASGVRTCSCDVNSISWI
uniref:Uncharacterized protein n=1 Tax=Anguilla anguilla TaxID=7936 RepID=A0A0E9UBI6_ANGAN